MKLIIDIPEDATNEDALNITLRTIFPRIVFIRQISVENKAQAIISSDEWLEMPYKGGK